MTESPVPPPFWSDPTRPPVPAEPVDTPAAAVDTSAGAGYAAPDPRPVDPSHLPYLPPGRVVDATVPYPATTMPPYQGPTVAYQGPVAYQDPAAWSPTTYGGYGGYGAGQYPGQQTYPGYPASRTNGLAVAALVTSIVGAVLLICDGIGTVIGLVGAILGHVAHRQISRSNPREEGAGLALAAIIVGWIVTGIGVIVVAVLVAVLTRLLRDGTFQPLPDALLPLALVRTPAA